MKRKLPSFLIAKKKKKTIVLLFVGRAKNGKSFLIRFFAELAGLLGRPGVLLIDGDEQADRDFMRLDKRIIAMPLKDRDDATNLLSVAEGCSLIAVDMPGAAQGYMEGVCADRERLEAHNVELVPVIVTTDLSQVTALTRRWFKIFQNSQKGFLVLNQISSKPVANMITLQDIPTPAPKALTIMRIPPMAQRTAAEISRTAAKMSDIYDCLIDSKESEILSMGIIQTEISLWCAAASEALEPLWVFAEDSIADEPVEAIPAQVEATSKK